MPYAEAAGARLYYEEAGDGDALIFVHEFAGDHRSWEPQMRHFSRRYRCISYAARGYPPSDVPEDPALYSQDIATDDIAAVLRHLEIAQAHIVGCSMGGFATLHFAMRYPAMTRSAVVVGCGYGAKGDTREQFKAEVEAAADRMAELGMQAASEWYGTGPTRVQYQNKDARGWQEFKHQLAEHSSVGASLTMRGVQARRPSLWDLEQEMRVIERPILLVTGDEDEPCLDANVYMKRQIATSGLLVMPKTGHACNLEEPGDFNRAVADFFALVEAGRWDRRDPRSEGGSILTTDDED